ncbi:unnamed protein product [Acanthoscelides obtectus]|uniref:Uncharacterized protein n=1 Tax=Acanthoscelides obtectus TaxID=200917 RepID=A0A9P0PSQ3_ACAOB|nr:unnamed protein product [Acanthoscelides obtectus]CAK1663906.1 hypothetical protein AOBTE_LOCUS23923 [Acanthoscelides obtectus]
MVFLFFDAESEFVVEKIPTPLEFTPDPETTPREGSGDGVVVDATSNTWEYHATASGIENSIFTTLRLLSLMTHSILHHYSVCNLDHTPTPRTPQTLLESQAPGTDHYNDEHKQGTAGIEAHQCTAAYRNLLLESFTLTQETVVNQVLAFLPKRTLIHQLDVGFEQHVQERVSAATGLSLSSIRRVKKEAQNIKEHVTVSFPKPKRTNIKTKVALDGFDQGLLRRTIINYLITEKRIPTLHCIYRKMRDVVNYKGCKETLRKEIHKLAKYRKEGRPQEPAVVRVIDEVVIDLNEVDSDSDFLETETEDEDAEERSD